MHILFAEDSRMIALPIIQSLEQAGHRVTHVTDGKQAVEKYQAELPDLVLMDVEMPIMDGIEATRRIKAIPVSKWVPLIIQTGLDSNRDLIRGLEAGADDYITKPVDFEVLSARLRSKQRIVDMQNSLFAVLDNVHEAILTIDSKGIIQRFNRAAELIFGYATGEVLGKNINMLMPEPHHSAHDGYLAHHLATGEEKVIGKERGNGELKGLHKSGKIFPIHLAVTRVDSALGVQFVGVVRDITLELAEKQRLEMAALNDRLTGLLNRAGLEGSLGKPGPDERFALLFLDLDGFKRTNDELGHDAGDMVLITVAERLREMAQRPGDIIARLGGDEFIVILRGIEDKAEAAAHAQPILEKIGEPMEYQGVRCPIGASIGVALYPVHGGDIESLKKTADEAMYQAKRAGKNRVVMAD